jgi:tRNA (guanine-N7-)-methyltransferase
MQKFVSLWQRWGLAADAVLYPDQVFARSAPCFVEIGFGNGAILANIANNHRQYNFIGIEVFKPGIMALLQEIDKLELTNVRVYHYDVVPILQNCIIDNSLSGIQIFFPDPWPKTRHHKRRLIQPELVGLLAQKLQQNGVLHLATDCHDYAQHMLQVLTAEPRFMNMAATTKFAHRSMWRPLLTKFERQAQDAGRDVWDLQFIRQYCDT